MGASNKDIATAEIRTVSDHELRLRAQDAAYFWLDLSRHERDEASGVWMARYIRLMQWQTMDAAPTDGTKVLLTDGQNIWIGSQRTGEHAGPQQGGQPTSGHTFPWLYDRPPKYWCKLPSIPSN